MSGWSRSLHRWFIPYHYKPFSKALMQRQQIALTAPRFNFMCQTAPRPKKTITTVRARIIRSSQTDQFRT